MNVAKFRKLEGSIVVFRPQPQFKGNPRKLLHNEWTIVTELRDRTFLFKNKITNHELSLGIDSIEKFHTPNFVILRGQVLLLDGGQVEFEPFTPGVAIDNDHKTAKWPPYVIFALSAIAIGIFALAFINYLSNRTERAHFTITEMWNTTKPIWPVVGRPLDINFRYKNVGSGTAFDMQVESTSLLMPDYSITSQEHAITSFEKQLGDRPPPTRWTQTKDDDRWSTTKGGPIFSAEDNAKFVSGQTVIFAVGIIQFRDDFGEHTLRMCRYLQPPRVTPDGRGKEVFGPVGMCERYNDEVDGWIKK